MRAGLRLSYNLKTLSSGRLTLLPRTTSSSPPARSTWSAICGAIGTIVRPRRLRRCPHPQPGGCRNHARVRRGSRLSALACHHGSAHLSPHDFLGHALTACLAGRFFRPRTARLREVVVALPARGVRG